MREEPIFFFYYYIRSQQSSNEFPTTFNDLSKLNSSFPRLFGIIIGSSKIGTMIVSRKIVP